eukprot:TRINITY_DN12931_c0_g1_i1.p1 TRINITY_DN12931_c0_g1~~TRINITY_DN12931_c0_g1_i1.p1  ORF type:complete len:255 (+),score=59.08 TRINITY_DN12931_c0_g1_i1:31-765(+)
MQRSNVFLLIVYFVCLSFVSCRQNHRAIVMKDSYQVNFQQKTTPQLVSGLFAPKFGLTQTVHFKLPQEVRQQLDSFSDFSPAEHFIRGTFSFDSIHQTPMILIQGLHKDFGYEAVFLNQLIVTFHTHEGKIVRIETEPNYHLISERQIPSDLSFTLSYKFKSYRSTDIKFGLLFLFFVGCVIFAFGVYQTDLLMILNPVLSMIRSLGNDKEPQISKIVDEQIIPLNESNNDMEELSNIVSPNSL